MCIGDWEIHVSNRRTVATKGCQPNSEFHQGCIFGITLPFFAHSDANKCSYPTFIRSLSPVSPKLVTTALPRTVPSKATFFDLLLFLVAIKRFAWRSRANLSEGKQFKKSYLWKCKAYPLAFGEQEPLSFTKYCVLTLFTETDTPKNSI